MSGQGLTPDQVRKVKLIKEALGVTPPGVSISNATETDRRIYDDFITVNTFQRSFLVSKTGRIASEWPARVAGIKGEILRARERLSRLNTGLEAERLLVDGLGELAAAFDDWEQCLRSDDPKVATAALKDIEARFSRARALGKSGLADLERGR